MAGDAVVGVIGAFAGVWAARHFGVAVMPGNAGLVIHAAAGAIVLLALVRVSQGGLSLGSKAAAPAKKAAVPVAEGPRPVRPVPRSGRTV
ncbi:GlsB/YeaQ/YmgE family stress response membrane protein [Rhodoplanes sp.]|uniref:GlsB/YeaQ/YmgE family stress response membrane protein n=1 Tax=Rhodoplanes sp. TaxID=1968906 RepID=UPI0025E5B2BB|nr:GlsB/YeaQ/YmgE family stress response membrane protein [Rhodoplanes sp.]